MKLKADVTDYPTSQDYLNLPPQKWDSSATIINAFLQT